MELERRPVRGLWVRDTLQNNFSDEGHPRRPRGIWSGREAEITGEIGAS